jgi:hypothetical protein
MSVAYSHDEKQPIKQSIKMLKQFLTEKYL